MPWPRCSANTFSLQEKKCPCSFSKAIHAKDMKQLQQTSHLQLQNACCRSVVYVDKQLLCHVLLQYPPISSRSALLSANKSYTPLSIHTASCSLPQHLLTQLLTQPPDNLDYSLAHGSLWIHCLLEIKDGFLCSSRQQHLMLHKAGLCLSGLESLQPSSHKPTFKGLRKIFPPSIGYSALSAQGFLSSSAAMPSQSM